MNVAKSVGDIALEVTNRTGVVIRPRDITDLFYARILPGDRCPIVGGRRLIPPDLVPAIVEALSRRGRIPADAGEAVS
jgi:hypothetical protein